jgi:putative 4-mercaptohistidine N1-methyltranferase
MSAMYESEKLLAEYLLFHFGSDEEVLPPEVSWPSGMHDALGFPCRTVAHFGDFRVARGLDLGCAVGRSTFEMTKNCDSVLGIDFSQSFVVAATALARGESVPYERLEEGRFSTPLAACVPEGIDRSRVEFRQGDATNLPADLGKFDRVHAANLLCRLPDPRRLLAAFPELVRSGGELVLATPCTWLEEFTPRLHWPIGSTFDFLAATLAPAFQLVSSSDEPFLIRESARKFQWSRSLVTVWHRVSEPATVVSPL